MSVLKQLDQSVTDIIQHNAFDRMFDDIFGHVIVNNSNKSFPKYNIVKHDEDNFTIELALAGFDKEDINIDFSQGILTISGEVNDDESLSYLVKGISTRSFTISFNITNGTEVSDARFENGILSVGVRKLNKDKDTQKIQIR